MDSAWSLDRNKELQSSELVTGDRARPFGCLDRNCPAHIIPVAIPQAGKPAFKRPPHFRTKTGSVHIGCHLAEPTVREPGVAEPAQRADGRPEPAPGRIEFDRLRLTVAAPEEKVRGTPSCRSVTRPTTMPSIADHVRTCTTIRPVCEYALANPASDAEPLELPSLGLVTYGQAFATIPDVSRGRRGWRIWRARMPFRQKAAAIVDGRIVLEVFAGASSRRPIHIHCSGWPTGLQDRLKSVIVDRLAAVEKAWRDGNRKAACEFFVYTEEPSAGAAYEVSHPGALCLIPTGID